MNEKDIDMSQVHDGRGPAAEPGDAVAPSSNYELVITINELNSETEHNASVENLLQLPGAIDVLAAGRNWTSMTVVIVNPNYK